MISVNRRRGEVAARIDGTDYTLCLTLGALAELEDAFAADDLGELAKRFSSGRLSARDMLRVIAAGLRGGGHAVSDEDVRAMRCEEGAAGLARVVSALLIATFGGAEGPTQNP
ncbi:gene transfer agent family protein [Nitratireductor sp. L15S-10]|uniref:gene transfer agent family protein n=1 Tax=Nitratireductor sp. L15S-10 TaxID=3034028 RepID=UPI003857EA96